MKIPSLKKFKITNPLMASLAAVFVLVILAELFVIYKYVYVSIVAELQEVPQKYTPQIRLDLKTYEKFETSLKARREYQLPAYSLHRDNFGRDNPFVQY